MAWSGWAMFLSVSIEDIKSVPATEILSQLVLYQLLHHLMSTYSHLLILL
jgi:hypothetical protein